MDTILQTVLNDLVHASLIALGNMQKTDRILANPDRRKDHEWAMEMKQAFRRELDDVAFIFETTLETNE